MTSRRALATRIPIHYAWVVAVVGMLGVFAALGLGRFALGMLLPSMGETLGLSYAEMGYVSTGNFVGYLAAVVAVGFLSERVGARSVIFLALLLVGGSMILVGRATGFVEVLLLYVLTGLGSGAVNVPVMALVSHWFSRRHRGKGAGVIVSGSGFGIMMTGLLVPAVNAMEGSEGWRMSWPILGVVTAVVAILAVVFIRDDPADIGLAPAGNAVETPTGAVGSAGGAGRPRGLLAHLGALYFLFGASYVIYVTFIVTTLVQERGFSEADAGRFWFWVGALSLVSGPLFGQISDWLGRKAAMAIVFLFQTAAYALVALAVPGPVLFLSVGLFGLVAWSIPGIMAATVGDYMGPARAASAFGVITFVFGIGQIVGPAVAGEMAEGLGTFTTSYAMAAAMTAIAAVGALFLPRPDTITEESRKAE